MLEKPREQSLTPHGFIGNFVDGYSYDDLLPATC